MICSATVAKAIDGAPRIAALAQRRDQGDLPQQRHAQLRGELLAPARPKELVAVPVIAGEPAHVLDHASHGQLHLARRPGAALRHALCRRLRGRHDVDLDARQDLRQGEGDVTGARWHVDEQEVRLTPPCLRDELLDGLVEHRASPDHRLLIGHEEAHRQAAHPVDGGRDHGVTEDDRVMLGAQHLGDGEAVDIGVEDADALARLGQRDGQVHRDRGLPHATLARGDAEDPGGR